MATLIHIMIVIYSGTIIIVYIALIIVLAMHAMP